jgi:hypothetical protein
MTEHALGGGNVAAGVVRVGDTVRKPAGFWTPAVEALLAHLRRAGFTGAPQSLGRDGQGRQVLEYVPGPLAMDQPWLDEAGLHRVGRLIRELHDRSDGFSPPPGSRWNVVIPPDRADLVCHHDLAPWNLVTGADRWVFIDWDGAGPGSRLWDLAYAMKGFVPLIGGGDPVAADRRAHPGHGRSAGQRRPNRNAALGPAARRGPRRALDRRFAPGHGRPRRRACLRRATQTARAGAAVGLVEPATTAPGP